MSLSDDAKAVVALTTRIGNPTRPSLSPSQWAMFASALRDASLPPAEIFAAEFDPALPGVPEDIATAVRELLVDAASATVAAAELTNRGIWTLTIADEDYPAAFSQRLGQLAPPVIFGVGAASLLRNPGIAIVGSRHVTEAGAAVAEAIAAAAVAADHTVASGGAPGVDQMAMNGAFRTGGRVLGVLADSLQARIRNPDILRALDAGKTTLITHQAPSSGLTPASAMERNKLIYAMARVTVVIASDEASGSTWAGAAEALKTSNGIVAVWRGPGEGPGNGRLQEIGAVPVQSAEDVIACLDAGPLIEPEQQTLAD